MSNLPTVFEIKQEFHGLLALMASDEIVVDEETGEVIEDNTEILHELMAEIEANKAEKLENIEYIKKQLKVTQDALKIEARRISERAKSLENNQKKLLELQDFLLSGEKLKTDKFTFFYASSESLDIEDESVIPAEFVRFELKIDKTSLKKEVKAGRVEVDGISLKTKIGLRVR